MCSAIQMAILPEGLKNAVARSATHAEALMKRPHRWCTSRSQTSVFFSQPVPARRSTSRTLRSTFVNHMCVISK